MPVLPGVECEEDWRRFLEGIRNSLAPGDAFETELVDKLAAILWKMRRLGRHEVALTMRDIKDWHSWSTSIDEVLTMSAEQEKAENLREREFLRRLEAIEDGSAQVMFSPEETKRLLQGFGELLAGDDDEAFDDDVGGDIGLELEPRDYSAAELVAELQGAASAGENDWREVLNDYLTARRERLEGRGKEFAAGRSHIERHLVPGESDLNRVACYERHLISSMMKFLNVLERRQALRKGEPVAAPIAVDLNLSANPLPAP
jgi:hypothetical protein